MSGATASYAMEDGHWPRHWASTNYSLPSQFIPSHQATQIYEYTSLNKKCFLACSSHSEKYSKTENLGTLIFMSFCRILSLRYAVRSFFIISRILAKERDKKYSVRSGTKCKTLLLFVPLFSSFPKKICLAILYVFIIKLTKEPRRRVSRWRD